VLVVTGVKYPLQAAGWRLMLPREHRPPWSESIASTVAGDALGYVTWAGPITGEPVRALLTRHSVPVAAGIAAGAVERGLYNATALVLVLATLFLLAIDVWPPLAGWMLTASVAGSVAAVAWRRAHRRRGAKSAAHDDGHLSQPGSVPRAPRSPFLHAFCELWRIRRGVLPFVVLLCLAQHALLVYEAHLLLGVLTGGTSIRTALVFEAVTKIVNTVGAVVPGRIGISEGGSALLADVLGFSASHGLSLALMRRVRALIWTAAGLTLLPWQEARARRAGRSPDY
jgi:hypothetical protein